MTKYIKNNCIYIILFSFVFISSCAPRYRTDEEAAIWRNERLERLRAKVLNVLDGRNGPITLIFVPGVEKSMVDVSADDVNVCGTIIKDLYTFPDDSRTIEHFQVPSTLEERKAITVCYRYHQFTNVRSGIIR